MTDPVIAQAIKLRDQLLAVAEETERAGLRSRSPAAQELAAADGKTCRDAAKMLEKLGTEVTRIRLAIGNFRYGRLSRGALEYIAQSWSGDPRT